jgi:hypothetical protein
LDAEAASAILRGSMALSHTTKGRVISVNGNTVVFKPTNTTYELHLQADGGAYDGPVDAPVRAVIRGRARKVYTVPGGGLFTVPIIGPTRIVQGRVTDVAEGELAVNGVAVVNVTLPRTPGAVEMARGPIAQGSLVNVVLEPGATIEVAAALAPAHTTTLTAPSAPVE